MHHYSAPATFRKLPHTAYISNVVKRRFYYCAGMMMPTGQEMTAMKKKESLLYVVPEKRGMPANTGPHGAALGSVRRQTG